MFYLLTERAREAAPGRPFRGDAADDADADAGARARLTAAAAPAVRAARALARPHRVLPRPHNYSANISVKVLVLRGARNAARTVLQRSH